MTMAVSRERRLAKIRGAAATATPAEVVQLVEVRVLGEGPADAAGQLGRLRLALGRHRAGQRGHLAVGDLEAQVAMFEK